ncbi:hypothetical protein TNCV_3375731 [Trichonephila clavipes]|nr:hypothetical protein TNCV_3375731 [Trichonephila clavipes]
MLVLVHIAITSPQGSKMRPRLEFRDLWGVTKWRESKKVLADKYDLDWMADVASVQMHWIHKRKKTSFWRASTHHEVLQGRQCAGHLVKPRHDAYLEYTQNIALQHQGEDPTGKSATLYLQEYPYSTMALRGYRKESVVRYVSSILVRYVSSILVRYVSSLLLRYVSSILLRYVSSILVRYVSSILVRYVSRILLRYVSSILLRYVSSILVRCVQHPSALCAQHPSALCVQPSALCVQHPSALCVQHPSALCVQHPGALFAKPPSALFAMPLHQ